MRAVLQRVRRASVTVIDEQSGEATPRGLIERAGLLALIARKIADLRILSGERSVLDADAPVLVVSQFTLYADTRKGRRPSWNQAAPGPVAEPMVQRVVHALRGKGIHVEEGAFGAHMHVELVNDGPVTILLEA